MPPKLHDVCHASLRRRDCLLNQDDRPIGSCGNGHDAYQPTPVAIPKSVCGKWQCFSGRLRGVFHVCVPGTLPAVSLEIGSKDASSLSVGCIPLLFPVIAGAICVESILNPRHVPVKHQLSNVNSLPVFSDLLPWENSSSGSFGVYWPCQSTRRNPRTPSLRRIRFRSQAGPRAHWLRRDDDATGSRNRRTRVERLW